MKNQSLLRAIKIGLILNIILAITKLGFGYYGQSQALISDGYNSFSDVFMSVMIFFVIRIAEKQPDQNHPYGHQKYEGILYFTVGIIFLATSLLLSYQAITTLIAHQTILTAPLRITVYVSLISLIIKVFLAFLYYRLNQKYQHPTLKAEAKNHLIDSWSTLVTFVGLILTQFGFYIFDSIAALLVALFILRLAIQIIKEATSYLVDEAPVGKVLEEMKQVIQKTEGVISIDDLKVRRHMTAYYVDVEIGVDQSLSLLTAHRIAESVHERVEAYFPDVIHCMVHVNPNDISNKKFIHA